MQPGWNWGNRVHTAGLCCSRSSPGEPPHMRGSDPCVRYSDTTPPAGQRIAPTPSQPAYTQAGLFVQATPCNTSWQVSPPFAVISGNIDLEPWEHSRFLVSLPAEGNTGVGKCFGNTGALAEKSLL